MKIWKRTVSAFLAAVTAVTMLFAGSVTTSAADSPYSVEYYPSFDMDGTQKEVLMVNGLTYEEYAYYTAVQKNGTGYFFIGIYFNDETFFYLITTGTNTLVRAGENDGGNQAIEGIIYTIIVVEGMDANDMGVCIQLVLNQDKLSDKTRQVMRSAKTCQMAIGYNIDGTDYNYQNLTGFNETDFSVSENGESKSISFSYAEVKNQTYTGKARTPDVTVKFEGKTLKKGTDYTLTYKNNKAIGTASVTITGKGDYSGKKTLTFKIVPKKTTLTAKKSGEKINLSWKKANGAEKYVIYYREKGESKYKKLATVSGSKTSYSTSKLDKNKTYQFKIRSYAESGGKKYYSSYSKVVTAK